MGCLLWVLTSNLCFNTSATIELNATSYQTGPRYNGVRPYLNEQFYCPMSIKSGVPGYASHNEVEFFTTGTLVGRLVYFINAECRASCSILWWVQMRVISITFTGVMPIMTWPLKQENISLQNADCLAPCWCIAVSNQYFVSLRDATNVYLISLHILFFYITYQKVHGRTVWSTQHLLT